MTVVVLDAPEAGAIDLPVAHGTDDPGTADAVIVFAETRARLSRRTDLFRDAALRDALAWLAYPKGGRLGTDLNRESVAELLSGRGIRPVRQVAIDEVW